MMKVELPPAVEAYVEAQLARGIFDNPQDALAALLDEKPYPGTNYSVGEIREMLAPAIAQADCGETMPLADSRAQVMARIDNARRS